MKIVIFSGTADGRELSYRLAARGLSVTVCVATDYGREIQGVHPGVTTLCGRLDAVQMECVISGAVVCVDATHPYAVEVSRNIRTACGMTRVPYRRLLRERVDPDPETVVREVSDAADAAAYLQTVSGNILLATGVRDLRFYAALDPVRIYPRILPMRESLSACENMHIPRRNIIAMQGPFSCELNVALIRQYHIAYLVSKDGGVTGGFPEKLRAARETGTTLVLIRRPDERGESMDNIITEIIGWTGGKTDSARKTD